MADNPKRSSQDRLLSRNIIPLIAILLVITIIYRNKFSKISIYNNVINQKGYMVYQIKKPVELTTFIEPNWIPTKEGEIVELNEKIGRVGNVDIIIETIMHRGDDIYFNLMQYHLLNTKKENFFIIPISMKMEPYHPILTMMDSMLIIQRI